MESTKLLQSIEQLRSHLGLYEKSSLDIARDSVLHRLATINRVEMPPILDDQQRQKFAAKIDLLEGFLRSDDGADAIELMVNAFECYCAKVESVTD